MSYIRNLRGLSGQSLANAIVTEAKRWLDADCREKKGKPANYVYCNKSITPTTWKILKPGASYCAAFVFEVISNVLSERGINNPLPRTALAKNLLDDIDRSLVNVDQVPSAGSIFSRNNDKVCGSEKHNHAGIVIAANVLVTDAQGKEATGFVTIEGNTIVGGKEGINTKSYPNSVIEPYCYKFAHIEELEADQDGVYASNTNYNKNIVAVQSGNNMKIKKLADAYL